MIITGLRAENVLKYSVLDLPDIPGRGLIAVIGDNESGKSSIGESICFALFGRTFSLEPEDLDKVIRWGESRCSIKLDFVTPDGTRYQIARFLDELGNHGASISRVGEAPMVRGVDEVTAALRDIIGFGYPELIESFYLAQREITTPHPHSHAVKAMAGVDALERIDALCRVEISHIEGQIADTRREQGDVEAQLAALGLDPGHLDTLIEERHTEEAIAEDERERVVALKADADQCDEDVSWVRGTARDWLAVGSDASFAARRSQLANVEPLIRDLGPAYGEEDETAPAFRDIAAHVGERTGVLAALGDLFQEAAAYRGRLRRLLGDEDAGIADAPAGEAPERELGFPARQEALEREETDLRSRRQVSRVLAGLLALLGIALWTGWVLLSRVPEGQGAAAAAGWLADLSDAIGVPAATWVPVTGAVLALAVGGFLLRARQLGRRIAGTTRAAELIEEEADAARAEADALADLEDRPLPEAITVLTALREPRVAERAADFAAGPGTVLLDPTAHALHRERFRQSADALERAILQIKLDALTQVDTLHESAALRAGTIARLDGRIEHERERVRRDGELRAILAHLRARLSDLGHRVRVRELALELLDGAIHYIAQRFNTEVRNLAAESLPKFTNGRYEHLQIDVNLKVKAFSNTKRNFMDLDEISSGTQRQIMLAVRMALSQKLVNSAIHGPQMLFLDEPFAFFDETRTASALAVLPQISGDFTQIWVTSQTFPAGSRFDMTIECNARESRSPVVHRGG